MSSSADWHNGWKGELFWCRCRHHTYRHTLPTRSASKPTRQQARNPHTNPINWLFSRTFLFWALRKLFATRNARILFVISIVNAKASLTVSALSAAGCVPPLCAISCNAAVLSFEHKPQYGVNRRCLVCFQNLFSEEFLEFLGHHTSIQMTAPCRCS